MTLPEALTHITRANEARAAYPREYDVDLSAALVVAEGVMRERPSRDELLGLLRAVERALEDQSQLSSKLQILSGIKFAISQLKSSDGGGESRPATSAVSPNHHEPLASDGKLRPEPMTAGSLSLSESDPHEVSRETKGIAGVAPGSSEAIPSRSQDEEQPDSTCYLERSAVRAILCRHSAGALLAWVDALPIFAAEDFVAARPQDQGETRREAATVSDMEVFIREWHRDDCEEGHRDPSIFFRDRRLARALLRSFHITPREESK